MRMSKLSPAKFAPELIVTMRLALDAAADQIDAAKLTSATKAKMAERVVRVAAEGVTDSEELFAAAIEEGKRPAD
jgi:hypothetical protein